jgi:hypothetical protein
MSQGVSHRAVCFVDLNAFASPVQQVIVECLIALLDPLQQPLVRLIEFLESLVELRSLSISEKEILHERR